MSLKYEPSLEPLHVSVEQLFFNWELKMNTPETRQALSAMLRESSHLAQALERIVGCDAEVHPNYRGTSLIRNHRILGSKPSNLSLKSAG